MSPPGSRCAHTIETVDWHGQIGLVDAARAAGVAHVIYISFTMDTNFPLRNAAFGVAQHLKQSGFIYTILRPSYFMEAWLSPLVGFDIPHTRATIYGQGHNPISWSSRSDVARFAVACLDHRTARNTTVELGGSEALSLLDVIRLFEAIGGRPLEIQHVPEAALQAQLAGAADALQQSFAGLMLCYAAGDPIDMRMTLQAFPLQLTSGKDYAQCVLTP